MKRHGLLITAFTALAFIGQAGDTEIIIESYSDGLNAKGFSQVEGKWNESTGKSTADGLQATKSVYNDADAEAGTARFTPDIPVAGKYEVFMTYPVQGNASDIKYTVVSAEGSKEVTLSQNGREFGHQPVANSWYSLGAYSFEKGTAGHVDVTDPLTGERPFSGEPNARIYADAVKFVPVDVKLPDDFVNEGRAGATPAAPATEAAAATPAPATTGLPDLPTAAPAAPAAPVVVADTPGLPDLPGQTAPAPAAPAVTGLPDLPAQAAPTPPSLAIPPADGAATALPALPASTPAIGLPDLPALASPPAPAAPAGLPALPAAPSVVPATPGAIGQPLPSAPPASASGIQWTYDFGSALNSARSANKKVLVFFTAEGNTAVETYESQFFTQPAVRTALGNFVLVRVDFPRNTRFAYTLGVFGAGTVVVTDSSGDVTARVTQLPATSAEFVTAISAEKLKPAAAATPEPKADDDATTESAEATTDTESAAAPADGAAQATEPVAEGEAAPAAETAPADTMM